MNAHQRRKSIRAEAKAKNLNAYQVKLLRNLKSIASKHDWSIGDRRQALGRVNREVQPVVIFNCFSEARHNKTMPEIRFLKKRSSDSVANFKYDPNFSLITE